MAAVKIEQSVIDDAVTTFEALVAAVNDFLAHPAVAQIPDAVVSGLAQAVADAGTAQTALVAAAPPASAAPPAPTP